LRESPTRARSDRGGRGGGGGGGGGGGTPRASPQWRDGACHRASLR